jgi:hypothetical protein
MDLVKARDPRAALACDSIPELISFFEYIYEFHIYEFHFKFRK